MGQSRAPAHEIHRGNTSTATGADPTKSFSFRYRLVPLADLITSHTTTMALNPEYPKGLQPRLRDREASRQQIQRIAARLEPNALLSDVGTLDRGPMIIGPDRVVESGNGRTIALSLAKTEFPEQWGNYQSELRSKLKGYGLSTESLEAIRDPVLVRERLTDVDRVQFAASANQATTLAMSPLEQALQDANRLSDETVANLVITEQQSVDQAIMSASNKPLVSAFFKEIPEYERAALTGAHGELNIQGLQRIKAALFAKVYPGEAGQRLTQAFFESLDPTVKTIENALFDSLPQMAKAEALIRSGQRRRDLSLVDDLSQSIDLFSRLKQQNKSVENYLRQSSFEAQSATPQQGQLLAYFDAAGRSRKMVREFLRDYAEAVIQSPPPQQMTMLSMESESLNDMVTRMTERRIKEAKGEGIGLFGLAEERERAGFKPPTVPDRPQLERPISRERPTGGAGAPTTTPEPKAAVEPEPPAAKEPPVTATAPRAQPVKAEGAKDAPVPVAPAVESRGRPREAQAPKPKKEKRVLGQATVTIQRGWGFKQTATQRGSGYGRVLNAHVSFPDGRNFTIPVEKDGSISSNAAIVRFLDVEQGDREGKVRSPMVDLAVRADSVASDKPKTEEQRMLQYLWWMHPNEMDIKGVDTPGSEWAPPPEMRAKGATMAIVGTEADKRRVLDILMGEFTKRERQLMKGLLIEVVPNAGRGVAGFYQRARGGLDYDRIVIGRKYLTVSADPHGPMAGISTQDSVVSHEIIHFLRDRDDKRVGFARRPEQGPMLGSDKDIEESFTSAEEVMRGRQAQTKGPPGYYPYVVKPPKTGQTETGGRESSANLRIHDKQILMGVKKNGGPLVPLSQMNAEIEHTRSTERSVRLADVRKRYKEIGFSSAAEFDSAVAKMFKGRKGVRAHRLTSSEFQNLAIARANIRGRGEAIDTYWKSQARIQGKNVIVATHVYSPDANLDRRAVIRDIASAGIAPPSATKEWQDGKLVPATNRTAHQESPAVREGGPRPTTATVQTFTQYKREHGLEGPLDRLGGSEQTPGISKAELRGTHRAQAERFQKYQAGVRDFLALVNAGTVTDPSGEFRPTHAPDPNIAERGRLIAQAAELRGLAKRGMKPRAHRKRAAELEARATALDTPKTRPLIPAWSAGSEGSRTGRELPLRTRSPFGGK